MGRYPALFSPIPDFEKKPAFLQAPGLCRAWRTRSMALRSELSHAMPGGCLCRGVIGVAPSGAGLVRAAAAQLRHGAGSGIAQQRAGSNARSAPSGAASIGQTGEGLCCRRGLDPQRYRRLRLYRLCRSDVSILSLQSARWRRNLRRHIVFNTSFAKPR